MKRLARLIMLLGALALPSYAGVALAAGESTEQLGLAKERFREATLALERGAPVEAARLFEEAYRLAPRAQALFNAAVSWEQAGERERAADAYEYALGMGGLDGADAERARERLEVLKRMLGYITIGEPVGGKVSVGHLDRATIPVRTHLQPGSYLVRIERAGGAQSTLRLTVRAGQAEAVRLEGEASGPFQGSSGEVAAAPKRPPATVMLAAQAGGREQNEPGEARVAQSEGGVRRTLGWVGVGAGLVLSGAAVVFGRQFLEANRAWDASGNRDRAAESEAKELRLRTNLSWASALATGGTGVFLLMSPSIEF